MTRSDESTSRAPTLLIGGVAIVLLAFVVFWPGQGSSTHPPPAVPGAGDAAAEPAPESAVPVESARDLVRERQAVGAEAVQFVVLEHDARTAVAGAEVVACDFDEFQRVRAQRDAAGAPLDAAARTAVRVAMSTVRHTDERGQAGMPMLGTRMLVVVTAPGGLWGQRLLWQRPTAPVEILVAVDRTLRVQVQSQAGQPVADVPVELRRRSNDGGHPTRRSGAPDGIAVFEHVQATLDEGDDWYVGFGLPLPAPPQLPVARTNLPAEPLVLVLPATGSLRIELVDEDERPVDGAQVELHVAAFEDPERGREVLPGAAWSFAHADAQGIASVPQLGLGFFLRVVASAREPESGHRPALVDVAGPRLAGEVVHCEVPWPSAAVAEASYPVARGRFVRSDGTPWPAAEVDVWASIFPVPAERAGRRRLQVAGDGRFELLLREPCPPDGVRIYRLTCRTPPDLAGVEGRLDLSRRFPPGVSELGDVVLDHGALLASGTIVDAQGAPIAGASVQLCQFVEGHSFAGANDELWPTVDCAGSQPTPADGSFALRAIWGQEPPHARLRVHARADGFAARDVDVRLGERGVRVVLERTGALAGAVRLGPGQQASDITLLLKRGEVGVAVPSLQPDGSFEKRDLAPGSLRLLAWLNTGDDAERKASRVTIDDLVIVAGETNRDPRIQALSIAGTAAVLTVHVTDHAGAPIERAVVEGGGSSVLTDAAGLARLRPAQLPADVHVTAFGHRDVQRTGVREDLDVALDPALRIRLVTDARPQGHDPDYQLGFFLYHVDGGGRRRAMVYGRSFPFERMYFDTTGAAALPVPGPGCYEVAPRVFVHGKDNVGRGGMLPIQPAPRFTVLETAGVQTFEVPIPQAVIDVAVREYDR
ncbi:MAG TPA: carboxypeptidase-like regulatory domain-containing protein [Planctomycetota bacterium]|nr:carboxypeptidase-like regulatory domain-containing protein [Planctomycetota bacterium]